MIPQDKIIEWAREADIYSQNPHVLNRQLEYFANLVAQYQKEQDVMACKRIAKNPSTLWEEIGCWKHAAENCEAEIRSQE